MEWSFYLHVEKSVIQAGKPNTSDRDATKTTMNVFEKVLGFLPPSSNKSSALHGPPKVAWSKKKKKIHLSSHRRQLRIYILRGAQSKWCPPRPAAGLLEFVTMFGIPRGVVFRRASDT